MSLPPAAPHTATAQRLARGSFGPRVLPWILKSNYVAPAFLFISHKLPSAGTERLTLLDLSERLPEISECFNTVNIVIKRNRLLYLFSLDYANKYEYSVSLRVHRRSL